MDSHFNNITYSVLLGLVVLAMGHGAEAQNRPPTPYVEAACPFECCQFGEWHTKSSLVAYSSEGDTSRVAFTIAVGDSFRAIAGNVHMDKFGEVVVTKPIDSFVPGDTLYTLSYTGEGYIDVWHNGTESNIEMFWDTDNDVDFAHVDVNDPQWSDYSGVLVQRPLMVWWVKVANSEGSVGWLRLVNITVSGFAISEQIDGMDGCS